jgi:hypothetical protein
MFIRLLTLLSCAGGQSEIYNCMTEMFRRTNYLVDSESDNESVYDVHSKEDQVSVPPVEAVAASIPHTPNVATSQVTMQQVQIEALVDSLSIHSIGAGSPSSEQSVSPSYYDAPQEFAMAARSTLSLTVPP